MTKILVSPLIKTGNWVLILEKKGINLEKAKLVNTYFEAALREVMQNFKTSFIILKTYG